MAKGKKARHLTMLLVKENYKDFKDALKEPDVLNKYRLKSPLPFEGTLFVQPTKQNLPAWVEFVQSGVKEKIELSNSASNSAVLFIKSSNRTFAFTFGHGRYLLKPNSFEQNFGLKVAINAVNPERLRSIDVRTFEELPLYTRQQASIASSLGVFDIDIDSDLLRGLTGEPSSEDFALRLTGTDSLAISVRTDFQDIGNKCKQVLTAYKSNKYKKYFSWVDHLQSISDPTLKDKLDDKLTDLISKGDIQNIYLCPPEVVDWEIIDGFSYSPERTYDELHADLDINDYCNLIQDEGTVTAELLKKHRVNVKFSEIDELSPKWSVYECIVVQVEFDNYLYVLTGGQWFQIEKQFAARVLKDIQNIPNQDNFLLKAETGEKEGDYNERVARGIKGIVLMDKKNIRCEGAKTPVEFCDLFSKDKRIIHVKGKTRSAMVSHLLGQGAVSAELFLRDYTFRERLRSVLKNQRPNLSNLVPKTRPQTSDYEVVYAIITDGGKKWPDSLPFFSQLYLRQNAQRLTDLGYRVLIARIRLNV